MAVFLAHGSNATNAASMQGTRLDQKMARGQRYYSDDDIERGVTPSELKRLGRSRQKEYMLHWFYRNFEDPTNETPRDDGEFIYIWGGPYDARDELWDEFRSIVPEDRIEEVISEVEASGIQDWAPGADHPSTKEREEEWLRPREQETTPQSESLEQITDRLRSGVKPTYGDGYELEQRRAILGRLDTLKSALAKMTPAHGGIGHNRPPPDDDSPQALAIIEIREAEHTISRELAKAAPNALEIANATSRLRTALGWIGKKLDKGVDAIITVAVVEGIQRAPDVLPPNHQGRRRSHSPRHTMARLRNAPILIRAAGKEVAALEARQQYLTQLATKNDHVDLAE